MVRRYWDRQNRYPYGFIKEFGHWVWEVSYRQHTLGSFILFAKRPVERFSELTKEELGSLGKVMKEVEETYQKIATFKPDWFNYWQMGNSLHHLHIHGFPRYKEPRTLGRRKWVDRTWGHPPVWSKKDVSHKLVAQIREIILPYLRP